MLPFFFPLFLISAVTSHLVGLHSAATMLTTRVESVLSVLQSMQDGRIPFDTALARQCAAFAARLPATDTANEFATRRAIEACDAMLSVLLAGVTTGTSQGRYIYLHLIYRAIYITC